MLVLNFIYLFILTLVKVSSPQNACGSNFSNITSSGLCFSVTNRMNFTQALKYCYEQGGHLASFFEVHEAVWEEFNIYHIAIHNLFTSGNNWFDLKHGQIDPTQYFNHTLPQISQNNISQTTLHYVNFGLQLAEMNSLAKAVCAKHSIQNIYEKSSKGVKSFKINRWPNGAYAMQLHNGHSFIQGDRSVVLSYAVCLAKCLKNLVCTSVYYSPLRQTCIQRLYMDAPISAVEQAIANDFIRFSIDKAYPAVPTWANDPVPLSYNSTTNNSNFTMNSNFTSSSNQTSNSFNNFTIDSNQTFYSNNNTYFTTNAPSGGSFSP